jgi:GT2 family glycosyltransferase
MDGTQPLKVSVVVVSYNGRDLIGACLDSLLAQIYPIAELILVDNGSSDGTVRFVRQTYPVVRVVELANNRGFAGGANVGIRSSTGELVAFLNSDATADPGWLTALVRVAQSRPDVGMVASQMRFMAEPNTINSAGICLDRAGVAWDRGGGAPAGTVELSEETFGACGGAALYRRALFDDVGVYDDEFFMYLEDVDLAWRAQLAGWRCAYASDARVLHRHSASAVEHSPFKRYLLARNKVWLIAKNYPTPDLFVYLPVIVGLELGALAVNLFGRTPGVSRAARLATIRGRFAGLATIGVALRKRGGVQRRRRVPLRHLRATLEPVAWPWVYTRRFSHLYPNDHQQLVRRD